MKECRFVDPKLNMEVVQDEQGLKVEFTAEKPAFLFISSMNGKGGGGCKL